MPPPDSVSAPPAQGLPARLAFVAAASIVPAALLAISLVAYDYYDRERDRMVRDSTATARALIVAAEMELAGVKAALVALATSPHLASDNLAAFHAQALAALKDQNFDNVVLIDEGGRQLVNTLRRFGEPLPALGNPPELQRIFQTGQPVLTDLFIGPVAKKPYIAFGVPVRRDGKVRYSLIEPARLSSLLSEQRLPPGWIAEIFDSHGTVVARNHEAERFVGQKGSPELVRRSGEVREDALETRTLEGIPVLTVFSRSVPSNWMAAIGIPLQELTAHLWHSMARLFVAGFIALLTAVGLAAAFGRRLLAR